SRSNRTVAVHRHAVGGILREDPHEEGGTEIAPGEAERLARVREREHSGGDAGHDWRRNEGDLIVRGVHGALAVVIGDAHIDDGRVLAGRAEVEGRVHEDAEFGIADDGWWQEAVVR